MKLSSFSFSSHSLQSYLNSISPIVHIRLNVYHHGSATNSAFNVQNFCSSSVVSCTVRASFVVVHFLRYRDSNV